MRLNTVRLISSFLVLWVVVASAQVPKIGIIDIYGRRKVSEQEIRKALGVKEGETLPRSKSDVEESLERVPNVTRARLEAVCCEDGKAILYVGIEEKGATHFDYHDPPAEEVPLPEEIHQEYTKFLAAVGQAVRSGRTSEDLSQGHSLMSDSGVRKHQEKFLEMAKVHVGVLRKALRTSADEEHRAIAAYVLGYAARKEDVINDLQYALRDPDDTVRNNAMRALGAIAVLGARQQNLEIKIAPTWFIEMLDSLIWSDRSTAAVTLVTLTERRDPQVLAHLKERAVSPLYEMARWKHLPHALPAFILLGRIAGVEEEEIQSQWSKGEREAFLEKILKTGKR